LAAIVAAGGGSFPPPIFVTAAVRDGAPEFQTGFGALDPKARAEIGSRLEHRIGLAGVDAQNDAVALICTPRPLDKFAAVERHVRD
jgi:hypothetical protein